MTREEAIDIVASYCEEIGLETYREEPKGIPNRLKAHPFDKNQVFCWIKVPVPTEDNTSEEKTVKIKDTCIRFSARINSYFNEVFVGFEYVNGGGSGEAITKENVKSYVFKVIHFCTELTEKEIKELIDEQPKQYSIFDFI